MNLKKKVAIYEAALSLLANWGDGDDFSGMDEPGSADLAREALVKAGNDRTKNLGLADRIEHAANAWPAQPTLTHDEIADAAQAIRDDLNAQTRPRMSEIEFTAWYQAFLTAMSVMSLDPKTGSRDRGRLAEMQADEAVQTWKSKRMREGLSI